MHVSKRTMTVEWGDCDPANIVYFPRYFEWFDISTVHHFASVGLRKQEFLRRYDLKGYPMVDVRAVFHVPSTFGDEVTIETRISRFGRSSFDIEHRLMRGAVLAVEGFEKRVLVKPSEDGEGIVPAAIPEEVKAMFGGRVLSPK